MVTIFSQFLTLSFPFFTLSSYTLSHHNEAFLFSFRYVTFTLLGSSICSISKYFSISPIQYIISSGFKLYEQVDTSILALPLIFYNTFNNFPSRSSSSSPSTVASSSTSSSLWSRVSRTYPHRCTSFTNFKLFFNALIIYTHSLNVSQLIVTPTPPQCCLP